MSAQLDKIRAGERKFVAVCDLIKHFLTLAVIGILGWKIIEMMTVALQAKPDTVSAFAECLKEWRFMDVLLALVAILAGGSWYREHRRNNRLTRKNGELRHAKESADPVHTRSGLDEIGATPKIPKRDK